MFSIPPRSKSSTWIRTFPGSAAGRDAAGERNRSESGWVVFEEEALLAWHREFHDRRPRADHEGVDTEQVQPFGDLRLIGDRDGAALRRRMPPLIRIVDGFRTRPPPDSSGTNPRRQQSRGCAIDQIEDLLGLVPDGRFRAWDTAEFLELPRRRKTAGQLDFHRRIQDEGQGWR